MSDGTSAPQGRLPPTRCLTAPRPRLYLRSRALSSALAPRPPGAPSSHPESWPAKAGARRGAERAVTGQLASNCRKLFWQDERGALPRETRACAEGERRAPPPLPCMFSGICPCSPFDRASPRASVSTLGSMTRRLRAGLGAPCPSATPAPGHGSTDLAGARDARRLLPLPSLPVLPSLCSTPALAQLQREHRAAPAAGKHRRVPAARGAAER